MTAPSVESCTSPINTPAVEQALEWLITVWSREASQAELDSLDRWRAARPGNEEAWQTLQRMDRKLQTLPANMARATLRVRRRGGATGELRPLLGSRRQGDTNRGQV
jgi:transmembrane sensor